MGNTTLPIPIELMIDILQRCGRHDIYNFARTSKANYDTSVHLLYKHIDLVYALESGALERHEKYGVYDFIQVVDLPIGFSCPEFFTEPLTSDPVSDVQEALLKFKTVQELHIVIAEDEYSKTCPTARILRWVFSNYVSRLSTLFLEIYCFSSREQDFEWLLADLATFREDPLPEHDKLKTIKTWVTHSRPRKLMSLISPLLSPFVSGVEKIEIRTRCNLELDAEREWWAPDPDFKYLKGLEPESIIFAFIEDKNLSSAKITCKFITRAWPNLVELDLDLGVNQYIEHYRRLARLRNVQKLSIMFPYHSWDLQVREDMAAEAEYPATRLCQQIPSLQEISIKYMGGNGTMSQTAVFNCIRMKSTPDESGNQSEVVDLGLKELWGEKGDYEDIIGMVRLVREMETVLMKYARERIERYILVDELKVDGFNMPEGKPTDRKSVV